MKKPSGKVMKAKVMKASPKVMKASPKVMKAGKKPAVSAKSRKPAAEPGLGRKTGGKKTCVLFLLCGGWKAKSLVVVSWVVAGTAMA